ncbi:hypothetical protein IE53DRAFT_335199 [Violaceomyces palustris]|uniref:Uncharacterized protein n=1 Tax=Violaceomyces palustris TaxID=1673888 RepID=A0ACD0NP43_9BASI|nr:hypothetical protein IE53DRAFT_335199 [Violaceomyces palustris]
MEEGRDSRFSQTILLEEGEDVRRLELGFYRTSLFRLFLWYSACILSAGLVFVVDRWFGQRFWIRFNCRPSSLVLSAERRQRQNRFLVVVDEARSEGVEILPLKSLNLVREVPISDVFTDTEPIIGTTTTDGGLSSSRHLSELASPPTISTLSVLDYKATRLLLDPRTAKFRPISSWRDPCWTSWDSTSASKGLTDPRTIEFRESMFGKNQIQVEGKGVVEIMLEEVLHPFYVFQIYSIVLWCNDDYVPYAIVIAVVSIIGIVITTVTTKRAIERMRRVSRFSSPVSVLRDSGWVTIDSEDLVPGDVVDLNQPRAPMGCLPCDVLLLEGDCIVDEAMLTGESVPVLKAPCPDQLIRTSLVSDSATQQLKKLDRHLLYSGTRLIRVRPPCPTTTRVTKGLVIRTGFSTAKGSLVRQMLFPRPIRFKFYRDAFLFIGYLGAIALVGTISTIIYFHVIGVDGAEIALRSLDVLTIAVPPALPATLSICITFAIARLRRRRIHCTSPQRINVAGMVNVACFDKTGTLTEEGLDVLGVRSVVDSKPEGRILSPLHHSVQDLRREKPGIRTEEEQRSPLDLEEALATTHDLNLLRGEPIGEPLEVKMLGWTGRKLEEEEEEEEEGGEGEGGGKVILLRTGGIECGRPRNPEGTLARIPIVRGRRASESQVGTDPVEAGKDVALVRTFGFSAQLRRMSVIVKRDGDVGAQLYCKGAPEVVSDLCLSESLPKDYRQVLDHYTRAGFRVLALAGKRFEAMGWEEASRFMTRGEAEKGLDLLGLLIFENKLKEGTTAAIARLRDDARLPIKVCTGDSVLTAVSVARECGILDGAKPVYSARIRKEGKEDDDDDKVSKIGKRYQDVVEWFNLDDEDETLNDLDLNPNLQGSLRLKDVELAISGETYRHLMNQSPKETLERAMVKAKVFARMSPDQKQDMVERLQTLGYTVSFTGDGANDCGALKAADVGLSLSEAEASVAAPFTSHCREISCLEDLIREGRSALSVSFSMFKWMSVYSLTEYFTVLLLYGRATSMDNAEYLFIDVFLVLPIAFGLANTRPSERLSSQPPPSRLATFLPVTSMLGQVILVFLSQTVVHLTLRSRSWYQPPNLDPSDLELKNQDNTALFKASIFSYLISAICYSLGPPHSQPLYRNLLLFPSLILLASFSTYLLFTNSGPIFNLFGMEPLGTEFPPMILSILLAQLVLAIAFETWALKPTSRFVRATLRRRNKVGKTFKRVEREISEGL